MATKAIRTRVNGRSEWKWVDIDETKKKKVVTKKVKVDNKVMQNDGKPIEIYKEVPVTEDEKIENIIEDVKDEKKVVPIEEPQKKKDNKKKK